MPTTGAMTEKVRADGITKASTPLKRSKNEVKKWAFNGKFNHQNNENGIAD
jgi:hypothetical protein